MSPILWVIAGLVLVLLIVAVLTAWAAWIETDPEGEELARWWETTGAEMRAERDRGSE